MAGKSVSGWGEMKDLAAKIAKWLSGKIVSGADLWSSATCWT